MYPDEIEELSDVYTLYKRYASECVSEEDYKKLEECGEIAPNINGVFNGGEATYIRSGVFDCRFLGNTSNVTAQYKERIFLESWRGDDHTRIFYKELPRDIKDFEKNQMYYYTNYGLLFFDNFLVIASEEKTVDGGKGFRTHAVGFKPIAIPLKNIQKIRQIEYCDCYGIEIKFKRGSTIKAYLFKVHEEIKAYSYERVKTLREINWSFETNRRLGIKLSSDYSEITNNLNLIIDKINELIDCSIDYDKRKIAIRNTFKKEIANEIENNIYLSSMEFADLLSEYIDYIPDTKLNLKEKFQLYLNEKIKIEKEKEKYKRELDELKNISQKLEIEKQNSNLLKQIKIRMKIEENNKELLKKESQLNNLQVSYETYSNVLKELIQNNNENKYELAKKVYEICNRKKLTKVETEQEKVLFEIICKKLNIAEEYHNKNFFQLCMEQAVASEESDSLNRTKILSEVKYKENKEKSKIIGIAKYISLSRLEEQIDFHEYSSERLCNALNEYGALLTQAKATKMDWAIAGGIANGIAGPAAGLAIASDVQKNNEMSKQLAEKTRQNGQELMKLSHEFNVINNREIEGLYGIAEIFNDVLCDIAHTDIFFDYLSCQVKSYKINEAGYLEINTDIKLKKDAKFNDIPIIIDGSIKIEIYEGNKLVGDAYICAKGFYSGE